MSGGNSPTPGPGAVSGLVRLASTGALSAGELTAAAHAVIGPLSDEDSGGENSPGLGAAAHGTLRRISSFEASLNSEEQRLDLLIEELNRFAAVIDAYVPDSAEGDEGGGGEAGGQEGGAGGAAGLPAPLAAVAPAAPDCKPGPGSTPLSSTPCPASAPAGSPRTAGKAGLVGCTSLSTAPSGTPVSEASTGSLASPPRGGYSGKCKAAPKKSKGLIFGCNAWHFGRGGQLTTPAHTVEINSDELRVYAAPCEAPRCCGMARRKRQRDPLSGPLLSVTRLSDISHGWEKDGALLLQHGKSCLWIDSDASRWGNPVVKALQAHDAFRRNRVQWTKQLPQWAFGGGGLPAVFPSGPLSWPLWRRAVLLLARALRARGLPPRLVKACCAALPPGVAEGDDSPRRAVRKGEKAGDGANYWDDEELPQNAGYCVELHGTDDLKGEALDIDAI
eukprot:TRINITY_DN7456_c0_g1_i1.p1 TRINITY_DN7456_c0_g1~~TRINITY_DN7456_c0_g1_i1.p1  ORF type:complete len:478 (+),score=135.24 TRINITY_DN7456_c0_g1_i1:94-1434(+)